MIRAATMLLGLWIILLLMTLPVTAMGAAQAGLGALVATALAMRAGGASRAFSRLPWSVAALVFRLGGVVGAAAATIRAALAADVTLSPALVRIRLGSNDGIDGADAVAKIGVASGLSVVALAKDSLLAHALNEDNVDIARVRAMLTEGIRS